MPVFMSRRGKNRAPGARTEPERIVLDAEPGSAPSGKPPVRIYVGSEPGQHRAERVFVWSIACVRDRSRRYEIHLMKDLAGFDRTRWLTGFTNYRFMIPHFAGGTGNPFVTTDTAAALRARELEANILMKATKVDGVYSEDPEKNPHAVRYEKLTFDRAIKDNLRVMDTAAIDMCRAGNLPILVFNYKREVNIERAIAGHAIGTLVTSQ